MVVRSFVGRTAILGLLATLAVFYPGSICFAQKAAAELKKPAEQKSKYLRIERDAKNKPIALQTAVVQFVPAGDKFADCVVDLVGAVHVADAAYYEKLNKEFEKYDAVMYELVAPEGTRVPKGGKSRSGHPIGMIQNSMKDILGLEHQLEHIDYTRENLIHADMSPDQFSESMRERDESFVEMYFRVVGASMAAQSSMQGGEVGMLLALFSGKPNVGLKRAFAEQFQNMDWMMGAVEGEKGSTIISERNRVALEGMKKQLDKGKKKLAVFYGAGHLDDMAKRMERDYGFKVGEIRWIEAWDLRDNKDDDI